MSATFWPPSPDWRVKKRPPSRRRKGWDCIDCGVDTGFSPGGNGHYYMVHDQVWLAAMPDHNGQLCLYCLERRLGRKLTDADFIATPYEILSRFGGGGER